MKWGPVPIIYADDDGGRDSASEEPKLHAAATTTPSLQQWHTFDVVDDDGVLYMWCT